MKKIVVYTCNFGGYDPPRDDILCFTDKDYSEFSDNRRNSRYPKICPHLWLPRGTEWSIYIDANLYLKVSPEKLVEAVGAYSWGVFTHNFRRGLEGKGAARSAEEGELEACLRLGKDDPETLKAQIAHYRANGIDTTAPELAMCGIQIRRHSRYIRRVCESWWAEYCRWSCRDQLSFPVAVGKAEAKYLPAATRDYHSPWFGRRSGHGRRR